MVLDWPHQRPHLLPALPQVPDDETARLTGGADDEEHGELQGGTSSQTSQTSCTTSAMESSTRPGR